MQPKYLRSSSLSTFKFCEHKYFLDYILEYNSPANKSAQKGSIVHKALEILAHKKLCQQQGKEKFHETELNEVFNVDEINPELAIHKSYNFYVSKEEFHYTNGDFKDCHSWMYIPLTEYKEAFNPLKMNIIAPEMKFDFELKKPWAKVDGKYIRLTGTIDLMVDRGVSTIEIIDWKTGARRDWNKNKEKTYEDLCNDTQIQLYYYAATQLFPNIEQIMFTIFWIKDGGPFSLCLQKSDIPRIENLLKSELETIQKCNKPKLIYPNKKCGWCYFSKNSFEGPTDDFSESICQKVKNEVIKLGIDKVTKIRAKEHIYKGGGKG